MTIGVSEIFDSREIEREIHSSNLSCFAAASDESELVAPMDLRKGPFRVFKIPSDRKLLIRDEVGKQFFVVVVC